MEDIYIGRQPIFDRQFKVVAYELLCRMPENVKAGSGERMTAQVLVNTLMDYGLEKLAGDKMVYVNVSTAFLLGDVDPLSLLSPERLGVEVLEDVPVTDGVIEACKKLKEEGYTLLLDDVVFAPHLEPLVELADIIKVDLPGVDDLALEVRKLRKYSAKLLAEKVETYEEQELCRSLNFDLFQGYFFSKPQVVEGKKLPESKLAILRALQQVMTAEAISDIQDVIKQDVSLSYRLLKYINSAAFGMSREISSIEQALALLGLKNIRRWLSLLSLAALGDNKPNELMKMSLLRARLLENISSLLKEDETGDSFLLGMFSVLDALLDMPMEKALDDVYLPENVRDGLLKPESMMGQKLAMAQAVEQSDFSAVETWCHEGKDVSISDFMEAHVEAMAWADAQMGAITG
ncbi:MAG: HDOD domain-containing protein [Mariprofundaceae bacterium]